ncbi:glycoside hydrolase family 35 protein [Chitinophaga sp. Cy-1792]|uniref:glycoside hydrolase family 35 protein n=1 Tax=Chitinophaga sp. Cy-1792 TaxID=2608339 RepID=UPI00141D7C0F|nr:glycoside hydrolase family 35 protein [Chitinophaga sp. Cy-1792]NIG55790.1 beta-galactosidase [Chitinophaga sp. Cy-1792]
MKKFLLLGSILLMGYLAKAQHTFALGDSTFLLDGKPFQMISGEMHYQRIPRECWRDRLKMAKAMGLNTVATYVFWNLHEPTQGHYDFSGNNDVATFIKMAKEEGLWVILRPSPYGCAEWEFGGYPYWLQNLPGLQVRSMEPQYIAAYNKYIHAIGKQVAAMQINHGGNIIMTQIENEYGSYVIQMANEKSAYAANTTYLDENRKLFISAGFDGLLYTCDPGSDVEKGHLPGLLPAVNGIDDPAKVKAIVRASHNDKGPYYIAEWYPAWFDSWGQPHHTVPSEKFEQRLERVLTAGISINMYMFHGGTTRGYMNGANYSGNHDYAPEVSSYDYDAPLDEAGNATPKFMKFREIISRHLPAGTTLPPVPAAKPAAALPTVTFTRSSDLFSQLPAPVKSVDPLTFEKLDQAYGFVLYRTTIDGGRKASLQLKELRDYAIIFINGKRSAVLDRRLSQDSTGIDLPNGKVTLDILVENLGRINFGNYLLENNKGITHAVLLDGKPVHNWLQYKLPFADMPVAKNNSAASESPAVKTAVFTLEKTADTYLDMSGWGKGVVWVNGHHLGRYWKIGPQQTLYVPAAWLKPGKNTIAVLELLTPGKNTLTSLDHPVLDKLQ